VSPSNEGELNLITSLLDLISDEEILALIRPVEQHIQASVNSRLPASLNSVSEPLRTSSNILDECPDWPSFSASAGVSGESVRTWYHIDLSGDELPSSLFDIALGALTSDGRLVLLLPAQATSPINPRGLLTLYDDKFQPYSGEEVRMIVCCVPHTERLDMEEGFSFFISADDPGPISSVMRTWRNWEPLETACIKRLLQPGNVFVDIGAHTGYYTVLGARIVGRLGQVVAIEPDLVNLAILRKNVSELPHPEIVNIVESATGERNEPVFLYRSPTNFGDHRIFTLAAGDILYDRGLKRCTAVPVACRRMEDILATTPRIDLVKNDAQGLELAALQSMRTLLERDHPIIINEFWPYGLRHAGYDPLEMGRYLLELGYNLYQLDWSLDPIVFDAQLVDSVPDTGFIGLVAIPVSVTPAR
jgi:FkbM family methyltransferase